MENFISGEKKWNLTLPSTLRWMKFWEVNKNRREKKRNGRKSKSKSKGK